MSLREDFQSNGHLTLAQTLKLFNRKERSWLVRDAMGDAYAHLSKDFRARIEKAVQIKEKSFVLEQTIYWTTDYHFDWLVAVFHALAHGLKSLDNIHSNDRGLIRGNQEDIDMIVASGNTLLLIEAKGVGQWSPTQMKSKMQRFEIMAPDVIDDGGRIGDIKVIFLLCSPGDSPPKLKTEDWPTWTKTSDGKPLHFRLNPPAKDFLQTQRCSQKGKSDADGGFWHTVKSTIK